MSPSMISPGRSDKSTSGDGVGKASDGSSSKHADLLLLHVECKENRTCCRTLERLINQKGTRMVKDRL